MTDRQERYLRVIEQTPLVSIDLIIHNPDNKVLLGKRLNRPAKDFWFVPGGSIRKNERLQDALNRISSQELGFQLALKNGRLLGAYDHIYPDNFLGRAGINTHYVCLGYSFKLTQQPQIKLDDQHSAIAWFNIEELLASDQVHKNTKAYFLSPDQQS